MDLALIDGTITESESILAELRGWLLPRALKVLNEVTLPVHFSLFGDDLIPTNQRNLTDVRTRMGMLLEYELAKAIVSLLPGEARGRLALTHVIANRFPDLAFRTSSGGIGVRFEVKAIEIIAEEKAANFDTLIKDIRKGTDFVVVLVWEWRRETEREVRCPYIYSAFVMDAYQLALMRDCYWLNSPPSQVGRARQGFDLCFGVNCRGDDYNREEGNYGKLMRIFDRRYEKYLPGEVLNGSTLGTYYKFRDETIRLGLEHVGLEVGVEFARGRSEDVRVVSRHLPVVIEAQGGAGMLLIVGSVGAPRRGDVVPLMERHGVPKALTLNGKFQWSVRDRGWREIAAGRKPGAAKAWARDAR